LEVLFAQNPIRSCSTWEKGEPLWQNRFPKDVLERQWIGAMTSHAVAGQLQQRPTAREGGLFKRQWFATRVNTVNESMVEVCRAWDLASTPERSSSDADYTVGVKMAIDSERSGLFVMDVVRGRWSPAEIESKIMMTAMMDGEQCKIRIPQDPGAAGKFQASYLAGKLRGFTVTTEREEGSKAYRADAFAAQCEHGHVALVEGPWNQAFIDELCAFPNGAHDDQVDAVAAAFRALVRGPHWSGIGA
jgi:predicted phage terminase large subunit-like protein